MLCQSLYSEYAPQNVHVSHIVIDSPVDAPDTLGKMLGPEKFAHFRNKFDGGLVDPQEVAETYWHLHNQPPSTRTFELDIRSRGSAPWWSSSPSMSKL